MAKPGVPRVRLADLVASLSLACDMGLGQPQEDVLRQTVVATRLAAAAGLPEHVCAVAWQAAAKTKAAPAANNEPP